MNFGEKFPYALLFSPSPKSLSKLVIGVHLLPKFVEADCGPHLLPKFVEAGYWVHYTPIITHTPSSTPHSQHAPHPIPIHQLYTHHTQSHNPAHTPPPAS